MSFFEGLSRFLQGKPVFEDPNAPKESAKQPSGTDKTPAGINKADQRSFPVVRIEDVASHMDGDHLQVYGEIKNEWPEEVMLDKIRLLNTVRELDAYLGGSEVREFLLYDGPTPARQYYEAELDYKTRKEGDYFRAIHDVGFEYNGTTKTYSVDELRLRQPIRDIYG